MAGFTTDFSEVKEHAEFKEQPYEMIVYDAYEAVNERNGKKRVVIDYVVRNDIKQEMQNYHLWDEQYPNSQTGKYHIGILMGKAKALGIKEGQHYDSFEAFLNDFKGRTAKVTVKLDEFNGLLNELADEEIVIKGGEYSKRFIDFLEYLAESEDEFTAQEIIIVDSILEQYEGSKGE